jgi:pimeloyl-ACP methyl ester carboxylesterase
MTTDNQRWLIVTVHGIRTVGAWQERLLDLIRRTPPSAGISIDVRTYKYGYFLAFALTIPILRRLAARRFRSHLLEVLEPHAYSRVHLVAHSFGTYIACRGLLGIPSKAFPPVHTILLAGSVLPSWFRWNRLRDLGISRIVNDCGTKDLALLASQLIPGLGMAGREGFRGLLDDSFCNRFFSWGHSDYFRQAASDKPTFLERYWLPLLLTDQVPEQVDSRKGTGIDSTITALFQYLKPAVSLIWVAIFAGIGYSSFAALQQRNTIRADKIMSVANSVMGKPSMYEYAVALAATSYAIKPSANADLMIRLYTPLIPEAPKKFLPGISLDPDDDPMIALSPDGDWLGIADLQLPTISC